MKLDATEHIYFVGIGGIGMSALAQLLAHEGKKVSGSDREESPTTQLLAQKGIRVTVGHDKCNIPAGTQLLIYSDAVWDDNVERIRAKEMKIPEMSYFEALGEVSKKMRTLAVTGTHGKTTTTGMLSAILKHAGKEPTAVVGSIVRDFPGRTGGSNYLAGRDDLLVVEACEYRDHMLKLSPEILVVTNSEWDHTDFFPSLDVMRASFQKAACAVPSHGTVVADVSGEGMQAILSGVTARIVDYTLELVPELKLLGEFNCMNARAAKAAARAAFPDISDAVIDEALKNFKGSWRRFEYKGETASGALVYDDYAHHPTAIRKTIEAAREKFPGKKIVVAFHPHLYSRTRDLMDDFAKALALADEVLVAPIYPARENPIPGVTSEALAEKVTALGTSARAFTSLRDVYLYLSESPKPEARSLLITMGAGDIYKVAEQIAD